MEFLALENSSLVEEDIVITEIKQEIIDDEAEWIAAQAEESSTAVPDSLHSDSSDTQDAEITYRNGAWEIKQELSGTVNAELSFAGHFERGTEHEAAAAETHDCQICGQHFARAMSLNAHMRTVHTGGKIAITNDKLGTQATLQSSKAPETSVESPYSLRLRSSRKSPAAENTSDETRKPHACKICPRRFRISRDLNLHMRTHTGVKPNACSYCGKQFTTVSQMRSHHRTHTQEQSYKCSVCEEKFVWLNSLKRHMRLHADAGAQAYSCTLCSESFDDPHELESHMVTHGAHGSLPSGIQSAKSALRQNPRNRNAGRSRKVRWLADARSSCKVCGKSVVDMRKHMVTHTGEKRYQCILCGSCFSTAGTLTVHVRTHTGERPYGCDECGKGFTTRSHLNVHRRKHTREEPYTCALCGEKFVWLNSLKRHLQLHDDLENPLNMSGINSAAVLDDGGSSAVLSEFTDSALNSSTSEPGQDVSENASAPCEFCGRTFADMQKHRRMHMGPRTHQCVQCERCFTTAESLRIHMNIHTGEKKFVCAECGGRFRHMSHLRVHMRIHSEELRYECNICGEKFLWQNSLKRHRWKHDGAAPERKHACSVCAKSFMTPHQLRIHVQTHSGEKPHMCHQCGRRYASRSSLLYHQRYSHSAQPQPCPDCGKQFKSLRVVKQHQRIAHRLTLHRCPHCELEFRQQSWLDCHILSHSAPQPFVCDECRLCWSSETEATEPSSESQSQSARVTDPVGATKGEHSSGETVVAVPVPKNSTSSESDSSEASTSDAAGHSNHCNSDVPAGTAGGISALRDDGVRTSSPSVPATASRVDGSGSSAEPSLLGGNVAAGQHEEVASGNATLAASEVETVASDVGMYSMSATEKGELPAMSFMILAVRPPASDEVRCMRCQKIRSPQCCPVCNCTFASLSAHIGAHSGKNPYVISSLLGIKSTYSDNYSERAESGGGEWVDGESGGLAAVPRRRKRRRVPQQCTVCGRTYTKLAEHMARMHGAGEPCMCTDCGKFLRNANTLRTHMMSRTCLKSRVCPICERTCENDAGLKSHMRSHASIDRAVDGETLEGLYKEYRCDECGHTFSSSEALDAHTALHAAGNHHDCCICGRTFIHARSLRLHLRMHTGETPFECKACGKGFRSRKGLAEHRSVHTMEKRYACMTCGRRFRLYRTFTRHRVIHSGVKRYECEQCGMRFAFNHLRKRHMRTHSGEKPYVCGDCGDRFTQWNGLYQHRRRRCGKESADVSPTLM